MSQTDSFALVIFGITGNLASIKLIPALYDMEEKGLLPSNMKIVGNARSPKTDLEIRQYFKEVLHSNKGHKHPIKTETFERLTKRVHYLDGHLDDPAFYTKLDKYLNTLTGEGYACHNRIYYLATYPELYHHVFENLKSHGMNGQNSGWVRLMIEKPLGSDLKTAKELNSLLHKYFDENQIYRIDHYLGKETLQNILTFRFGNGIFEPLLNRVYVDHIQITMAEDFGIGKRGGYYDKAGALKDVGQNHVLQMLIFATMDAPTEFSNEAITKQRVKVLKSLIPHPKKVVFGQYKGYLDEENVHPESDIDTYFALKTEIDNPRFKGVPIYLRAGKRLKRSATEIYIVFKNPDNRLFKHIEKGMEPNILSYRISPDEAIKLRFLAKKPGVEIMLDQPFMEFKYGEDPDFKDLPDAYERLISDAIRGDQTFFNDAEEVEAQWAFVDQLLKDRPKPFIYEPGSWGPKEADQLIEKDGRHWLNPLEGHKD